MKNSTINNFLYNFTYQIILIFIPLFLTPFLSRTIGAHGMGIYSFTFTVVDYFVLFSLLGLKNYGSREIAMNRDNKHTKSKIFFELYSIQIISTIICILIYCILIVNANDEYIIIGLIQGINLIAVLFDFTWFFSGIEDFRTIVFRNFLVKIVSVLLIFRFVHSSSDVWIYAIIISLGTLVGNVSLIFRIKNEIIFIKPRVKYVLRHIKPMLILFVSVLSISVYKSMDKIMIKELSNIIELGYYEYADKMSYIQICITTALGTVMLPRMANLKLKISFEKVDELISMSMSFVMFLSCGICFGLIAISNELIPIYLGDNFEEVDLLLQIMSISGIFVSWANVIRMQYLLPYEKDKIYVISVIIGAIINFSLNIILIKSHGAKGAVIATLLTEFAIAFYQTFCVRNDLNIYLYLNRTKYYLISAVIMFLIIENLPIFMDNLFLMLFIKIIVGGTIYVLLCGVMTSLFDRDIFKKVVDLFSRKN